MKRKITVGVIFLLGVATIGLLSLYLGFRRNSSSTQVEAAPTPSAPLALRTRYADNGDSNPGVISAAQKEIEKRKAEQLEKYERYAQRAWNMPISFYGKVVDENGKPVEEAEVNFGWTDLSPSGTSEHKMLSDGAGLFSLEGARGKNLGVRVKKNGYYGSDRNRLDFEYADPGPRFHVPDRANPVIFHLRKKGVTEKLIRQHALYGLDYDLNPYYYYLQTGVITRKPPAGAGATLKISVTRSVSERGEPFNWTLTMEALNGGLKETSEEFPFLAPEDGYAQVWSASQLKGDSLFKQYAKANLYLRMNDGRYALIDFELRNPSTRESGADIIVDSYLNPSGSRNLEYDSTP